MEKKYKFTKKCLCCGKEFQTNNPQKLYCDGVHYIPCPICGKPVLKKDRDFTIPPRACSSECRQKLLQQNMAPVKCEICGEEFKPKSGRATICDKEHHIPCSICGKDMIVTKKMWHDKIDTCSEECAKEKLRRFYQEKYGADHPMQTAEVQGHHKEAMLKKYGVEHALQCEKFKQKASDIIKAQYGTPWAQQCNDIKMKSLNTMKEKYGAPYTLQSPELKEQVNSSVLQKHGVQYAMQHPDVKSKVAKTCFERYNSSSFIYSRQFMSKFKPISKINLEFKRLLEQAGISADIEYPISSFRYDIKVNDMLIEIDPSYSHTCNPTINHWHLGLDSDYHIRKSKTAEQAGYRCIHIFDWDNWDRILQLVKPKQTIYARKCYLAKVDKKTADIFTERYHLQGKCNGQKDNWGLYYKGELVEIMTFGTPRYNKKYDYELLRLCSKDDIRVVGGASKLFKAFRSGHPKASIISYCDLAKFTGQVYGAIGMKLDHISAPAKVWSKGPEYVTDNLLRQRGYDQLFNASYGKGTSNEELMLEHGWVPVYDCGQAVYIIKGQRL